MSHMLAETDTKYKRYKDYEEDYLEEHTGLILQDNGFSDVSVAMKALHEEMVLRQAEKMANEDQLAANVMRLK
jgi:hypothetical protein